MNICFVSTHVPDPKTNKRISEFKKIGTVKVICTRRKSQDIWEPQYKDVEHYIFDIDLPASNQIVKRAIVSRGYQKKAFTLLNEIKPEIIYADGIDSLIIASNYCKKNNAKLYYDVADLREAYIESPRNPLKKVINFAVKQKEKSCFQEVDYLAVTSLKFFDIYYYKLIDKSKVIYIPNAPDADIFADYKRKASGEFTIGFIGGIRYLEQMKLLVDAAHKSGCSVLFAGAGGTKQDYSAITEYCENKDWVKFTGKYNYATDIAKLYGMVDCVYAVYDADNPNVRIALPNKLYESILCQLPIIVAKNTYLSELVNEWGVGVAVNHKSVQELTDALILLKTNHDTYNRFVQNCKNHNVSNESYKLIEILNE